MSLSNAELKAQISARLVESGEYDTILTFLKERLYECGWYDEVKLLANSEISNEDNLNFNRINFVLEPKAMDLVPDGVKKESLVKIAEFLESIIE
ncbi:Sus1p ASCRUDRAFT_31548 [Ascoidea rubescens DSM 1968]|uniref:Transcription and mRNA export factor SUS1 n=1 Tax=Ascoidea rubescens DSM 1968 TaxID=1344418 RepID=A0A1D2VNG6_9ASCO|nr:hypothetical protein ASCRUDRAFT_31548 [Ascoidea rubescens DSM 1968]ODV63171.1 hypothetical protein ASCRUDRAFT_31548 [Ascoidea rubescens DSM 1968]